MTGFVRPDFDPFEGLPAHMVASRPLLARVEVHGSRERIINGERKIAMDARPIVHMVQLERDGRKLTHADKPQGWKRGDAVDWKPTKWRAQPGGDEIVIRDCEEEICDD